MIYTTYSQLLREILETGTNIFHAILPLFKYMALAGDSKIYDTISPQNCVKIVKNEIRMCTDHFSNRYHQNQFVK